MKTPQTFAAWMAMADAACLAISGQYSRGNSIHDLPDCPFRDWFDDGVSPKSAAHRAIRNAKTGEYSELRRAS